MLIRKGTLLDIHELENLYNVLNDYLEANINYPGWIKHVYPTKETATEGIKEDNLFVIEIDDKIAGSIILNNKPEAAYYQAQWRIKADYEDIIVIHTLVTHPGYMRRGVASTLMRFAKDHAIELNKKAIRLDVSVKNTSAIALYEKHGYKYIATVDLGLGYEHLKWFRLYELIL